MSIQRKTVAVNGLGGAVLLGKTTEQTATPSVPSIILPPGVRLEPEVVTVAGTAKGTPLPPPVPAAPTAKTNGKGKGKGKAKPSVQELEALLAAAKEEAAKDGATVAQSTGTANNGQEEAKSEGKAEPFDWAKIDLSKPYARQKAMLALCNSLMGRKWDRQFKSTSTPEYYWTLKGEADQRHAMNAIRTVAETLAALDPTLTVGPLDTTGFIGMGIEAAHNGDPTLTFAY